MTPAVLALLRAVKGWLLWGAIPFAVLLMLGNPMIPRPGEPWTATGVAGVLISGLGWGWAFIVGYHYVQKMPKHW